MGYRIHRGTELFKIVEVVEGEVKEITSNKDENKIRDLQRHLNFGGGFDGWTPDFFLQRLEIS